MHATKIMEYRVITISGSWKLSVYASHGGVRQHCMVAEFTVITCRLPIVISCVYFPCVVCNCVIV